MADTSKEERGNRKSAMNKFKYELGDAVVIDSNLQLYANINTDIHSDEQFNITKDVIDEMVRYARMTATIIDKFDLRYTGYNLDIDDGTWNWHQDLLHSVATRDSIDNIL